MTTEPQYILAKYAGKCNRCSTPFDVGTPIFCIDRRWYIVNCRGCAARENDLMRTVYNSITTPGPEMDGKEYLHLSCYCDFEGHGRASEAWETHWTVGLPHVCAYWYSTTGWRKCPEVRPMSFHSETLEGCLSQVVKFLLDVPKPDLIDLVRE